MTTLTGKILADFTTSLATAMAIGATTATLQSATDDDGVALPSGTYYFTLDGSNSSKEHIRCTLSGTSLTSIYSISRQGVATSGTVRAHRLGATVTLTDFAHIKVINDLVNGTTALDGSHPLKYDTDPSITDDKEIATKKYVDTVAIAGGADASSTVKGISKLSTNPVSPTNPIAVGDNDTRVPTQDENDALAGTSGTPSSTNKYVTNDDTTGTGSIIRGSKIGNLYFGTGADGDVTISVNTSLSKDMYYNNLTINTGVTLNPNGYRIFVKDTLTINGTGLIARNGNNGGNGDNATVNNVGSGAGGGGGGSGGSGGIVAVFANNIVISNNTSIQALGGNGGNGGNASNSHGSGGTGSVDTGGSGGAAATALSAGTISGGLAGLGGGNGGTGQVNSAGNNGGNGSKASTLADSIGVASVDNTSAPGGNGGGNGTGGSGQTSAGITNPLVMPYTIQNMINLFYSISSTPTPTFYKSSQSANSGGGGAGGFSSASYNGGGGGGGAGGSGGNGGIIVLVYTSINMSLSTNAVAGGTGGTGGTKGNGSGYPDGTNGSNGVSGATGVIYSYQIS